MSKPKRKASTTKRVFKTIRDASPARKLLVADIFVFGSGLAVLLAFLLAGGVVGRATTPDSSRLRNSAISQLTVIYNPKIDRVFISHVCDGKQTQQFDPIANRLVPTSSMDYTPGTRVEDHKEVVLVLVGAAAAHHLSTKHTTNTGTHAQAHDATRAGQIVEEADHGSWISRVGKMLAIAAMYEAGHELGRGQQFECDAPAVRSLLDKEEGWMNLLPWFFKFQMDSLLDADLPYDPPGGPSHAVLALRTCSSLWLDTGKLLRENLSRKYYRDVSESEIRSLVKLLRVASFLKHTGKPVLLGARPAVSTFSPGASHPNLITSGRALGEPASKWAGCKEVSQFAVASLAAPLGK